MTTARKRPPRAATFHLLVEAVGEPAAVKLAAEFGGRRLFMPYEPRTTSRLVRTIGHAAARALGKRYGGTSIDVPIEVGVAALVLAYREKGWTHAKIAEKLHRTERYVRRICAEGLASRALHDVGPHGIAAMMKRLRDDLQQRELFEHGDA